ncbi:DUF4212 domain-containing protein [Cupriavidus respiraculi]|uniref:Sodium symporter small subunit domain-containing protein n=1 Tax=Cupriavidus respiraculi TaxID=195930 RepID=A0ABM8X3X8_9BURK|nr:sodium/substrate symporter small subunit [Cupriavidus respiraculi]MBY4945966.1 DUF4212 domain-containing protein [Cupriavidus respiraculi]CAG9174582.1 hypothetical protein LMG21510_02635 [Cupriavidus respiraculi]
MSAADNDRAAWRLNVRWIAALLTVWFVVTFVVSWYARELRFDFFGWPFSFWAGAQGVLILYVVMAVVYAWRMNRADDEAADADERDAADRASQQGNPRARP